MPDYTRGSTTYSIRKTDEEVRKNLDPKYQDLYAAIEAALTPEEADSLSLWMSVQAELNRYGLGQSETAGAVVHTALLRGKRAIDQGKVMPQPSAWLRLTCRYIIKEKARARQREAQLDFVDAIADHPVEDNGLESANSNHHPELKKAIKSLSPLDQEILMLKVVQALRWEEIQTQLIEMGYKPYSLAALRKHKSRAVLKLRKKLASVYRPTRKEMMP